MNTPQIKRRDRLPTLLKLSLFISSYSPLFLIIIIKQISNNSEYLLFGGINKYSIYIFLNKFGIVCILSLSTILGIAGIAIFTKNMEKSCYNSGNEFVINEVQNKNSESIGYIATYLFPFLFQSYSSLDEILCFVVLTFVIYIIYTHSTMIVVNPVLNLAYSLYDISYTDKKSSRKYRGTFIIDCHYVKEGDTITAKNMGANLYFAIFEEAYNE